MIVWWLRYMYGCGGCDSGISNVGVPTHVTPRVGSNLTAMAMQCSLRVGVAEKRLQHRP